MASENASRTLYNYLILTPGITHEQLKAFKSMEGYNFYTSGKVTNITECYRVTKYKQQQLSIHKHYLFHL